MKRHGLKTEELTLCCYPSNLSGPILRDRGPELEQKILTNEDAILEPPEEVRSEIPYAIGYEMALSVMTKNVSLELSSEIPFIKFSL